MQKLKMKATKTLTFKEGREMHLEYRRQRNLREGTINHYRRSDTRFYKFFAPETPIDFLNLFIVLISYICYNPFKNMNCRC